MQEYIDRTDENSIKFSIKNLQLDESSIKAISSVIIFMTDIKELEFINNQMTDLVAGCLLLAVFIHPSIKKITIAYNYLRATFAKTLKRLAKD